MGRRPLSPAPWWAVLRLCSPVGWERLSVPFPGWPALRPPSPLLALGGTTPLSWEGTCCAVPVSTAPEHRAGFLAGGQPASGWQTSDRSLLCDLRVVALKQCWGCWFSQKSVLKAVPPLGGNKAQRVSGTPGDARATVARSPGRPSRAGRSAAWGLPAGVTFLICGWLRHPSGFSEAQTYLGEERGLGGRPRPTCSC